MDYSSLSHLSVEPSSVQKLTEAQKARLSVLLDRYLNLQADGLPPTVEELTHDDPDLLEPIRSYLVGLDDLHQIAVGFVPHYEFESSQDEDDQAGISKLLGDFQLLEEIGRGGMGVVYRAQQLSLDRTVAIKLLPFASLLDARQIARFKNEAQAAAQLHHPHIVPVYTVGVIRGVHYYAMQYIKGRAVDAVIAAHVQQGTLPEIKQMVALAIDVATALHAAHQFGVVHRDIKPSNLLLDEQGKIWVTDFGLARCQTEATFTKTGDVVGTMKYMSPEQAHGETALIDGRTDIYSLGATLFEMLTLIPAFTGSDAPSVLRNIDDRAAPSLRTVRPDVPRDLDTVLAKAMAKSRDERYATAELFAADLGRVLRGEPTLARPPSLADRLTRWSVQHRRIVGVSFAFGLLALISFAVAAGMIASAKQDSDAFAKRALENESLARAAVDRLGAQVAELLADVPAADSVRQRLLEDTLSYYQSFAEQADDDPKLMKDLAITYGKIGSLQNEVGRSEEAIVSLQKSTTLFNHLTTTAPNDQNLLNQFALSLNNLALAQERIGHYEAAKTQYAKAIQLHEMIANHSKEQMDNQANLALTLNNLALLLSQTGDLDAAESSYRRSIQLLESSAGESRATDFDLQLAATYRNLSSLLIGRDATQAAGYARTALKSLTQKLPADKGNPSLASQLASSLNVLGEALAANGETEHAIDSFQQAAEILIQLIERWPEHLNYQRDLAITHNNLGLSLAKLGKSTEAETAFMDALHYQKLLVKRFNRDPDLQSTLGGIYNNLAFVQEHRNLISEAIESYRLATEAQTMAYERAPQVPRYREYLSKHLYNQAKLLRELGKLDDAILRTQRRRDLWAGDGLRLAGVAEEFRESARLSEAISLQSSQSRCMDLAKSTMALAIEAGYSLRDEQRRIPEYASLVESKREEGTP